MSPKNDLPTGNDTPTADPLIAEYDVYLTPALLESLYILQYPNRSHAKAYSEENDCKPSELRIKPKTGFIEVDVPMNVSTNFDKRKSISWGQARRRIVDECNGQVDFGIASGFSSRVLMARGPRAGTAGAAGRSVSTGANAGSGTPKRVKDEEEELEEVDEDDEVDKMMNDFTNSNQKGYVMNTQTLGGQVQNQSKGDCFYMMGAFQGNQLHLTKVDGIVQMRPQFHHLDAKAQLEDVTRRREQKGAAEPKQTEPRAVQIVVKTMNDDEMNLNNAKEFLQTAEHEPWTKLKYHDAEASESYEAFEKLRLSDESLETATKLQSTRTNEQFLEDISAPRVDPSGLKKKKPLTKKQMRAVEKQAEEDTEPMRDLELDDADP